MVCKAENVALGLICTQGFMTWISTQWSLVFPTTIPLAEISCAHLEVSARPGRSSFDLLECVHDLLLSLIPLLPVC